MLSRIENILQSIIDSSEYDGPVQSRIEQLLLDVKSVISTGGGGGVTEATVTTMIASSINALIDGAPDEYNTLGKIAAKLLLTDEQIQTITEQVNNRYTKEETNELVSKIPKFSIEVVSTLPTKNISTTTVYLKTGSKSDPDNIYDEYIYVKSKWELLGSQKIDLSGYVTTDTMNAALKNKLDKSGGTLTGALTTKDVKINGDVRHKNSYSRKVLGRLDAGTVYNDLEPIYKDGSYHRLWRLRFTKDIQLAGMIKINLSGSYNTINTQGTMSKTINVSIYQSTIYSNIGYYDGLSYLTEQEFRISEFIWNDTEKVWEILIWQQNLTSNCTPTITIENISITPDSFLKITALPVELTQMTSYTAPKASLTGGDKVVNWTDTPVFETPYGKEVATTDLATTSANGLMSTDDKKKLYATTESIATNIINTSKIPSTTAYGITRTVYPDGKVSFNGTSTLTNDFFLVLMASRPLTSGKYRFTPNGTAISGTVPTVYQLYKNGKYLKGIDPSKVITIDTDGTYGIGAVIKSKATINTEFYPMLESGSDAHNYVQYTGDTGTLNGDLAALASKFNDPGFASISPGSDVVSGSISYKQSNLIINIIGKNIKVLNAAKTVSIGTIESSQCPQVDTKVPTNIANVFVNISTSGTISLEHTTGTLSTSDSYTFSVTYLI